MSFSLDCRIFSFFFSLIAFASCRISPISSSSLSGSLSYSPAAALSSSSFSNSSSFFKKSNEQNRQWKTQTRVWDLRTGARVPEQPAPVVPQRPGSFPALTPPQMQARWRCSFNGVTRACHHDPTDRRQQSSRPPARIATAVEARGGGLGRAPQGRSRATLNPCRGHGATRDDARPLCFKDERNLQKKPTGRGPKQEADADEEDLCGDSAHHRGQEPGRQRWGLRDPQAGVG